MILQTGGLAMGDTSTRSRPYSAALARATSRGRTPSCSPSGPMTLSSRARIRRFVRASRMADSREKVCTNDSGGNPGDSGPPPAEPTRQDGTPLQELQEPAHGSGFTRRVKRGGDPASRRGDGRLERHGRLGDEPLGERVEREEAQLGRLSFPVHARGNAL